MVEWSVSRVINDLSVVTMMSMMIEISIHHLSHTSHSLPFVMDDGVKCLFCPGLFWYLGIINNYTMVIGHLSFVS